MAILTAIFQVNLGLSVFIEAKDDGGGGDKLDYWSYRRQLAGQCTGSTALQPTQLQNGLPHEAPAAVEPVHCPASWRL